MAHYVVGDIQGCYDPLRRVLDRVDFDPSKDTLLSVGDLVNRGPKSLKTLRFLKSLGKNCKAVLGNHDIHLLSMIYGVRDHRPHDTLRKIIEAPDVDELANWLRAMPLLEVSNKRQYILCHAGIYPWWSLEQAKANAQDVQNQFKDEQKCVKLLQRMYSNKPLKWRDNLNKVARWRFTINTLTRMRFCSPKGRLNFGESGYMGKVTTTRRPWFEFDNPSLLNHRVLFGHWSALGLMITPNIIGLDTGCVWGRELTLIKLPKKLDGPITVYQEPANVRVSP